MISLLQVMLNSNFTMQHTSSQQSSTTILFAQTYKIASELIKPRILSQTFIMGIPRKSTTTVAIQVPKRTTLWEHSTKRSQNGTPDGTSVSSTGYLFLRVHTNRTWVHVNLWGYQLWKSNWPRTALHLTFLSITFGICAFKNSFEWHMLKNRIGLEMHRFPRP